MGEVAEKSPGLEKSETEAPQLVIDIGDMPVVVRSDSPEFLRMLEGRYAGFISDTLPAKAGSLRTVPPGRGPEGQLYPRFEFDVELVPPGKVTDADDVSVRFDGRRWLIERGDLRTEFDPATRRGRIVQSANPYAIDAALRILHSLVLAREGGLLMHAASAVRNSKAFLFAGVSEAGKTTISRLAPPDATLLTDEISYLRRNGHGHVAYGTPFAGELAKVGENVRAPLAAVYLLHKGQENRIEPLPQLDAVRLLLQNVLFFAHDPELVGMVFKSACELARQVPVQRLTFFPDARVWELIG